MSTLSRRTVLQVFGISSLTPLLRAQTKSIHKAVMAKPGESRFHYSVPDPFLTPTCKLSKGDSAGACSSFEVVIPPKGGPPRHIHHREDEWYYIIAGEFLFEVGDAKYSLPVGGSIWAPRDVPHVWANGGTTDGKMIFICLPGGFENFFEDSAKGMNDKMTPAQMERIMNNYGMELLGPPLFAPGS
jgi:mannose-6-phosphate isomerase-like protein (cupin superfamily)